MNSRILTIIGVLIGMLIWSAFASGWADRGCSMGQGYAFALRHGKPAEHQGCEPGPSGPEFTYDYRGESSAAARDLASAVAKRSVVS